MAAKQANFRMEPGSDAMKQRMQAMMRYNRLRQETRASNAVLQVKRKHQRREPVDPRADETSLERQQMQDRSYYEYGCVTDGLRADLGLERYHEDLANHSASVQESAARPIEEDLEEGEDDDERRREKARRRRKAGMRDIRVHPFEVDELDHRCCRGQMPGWDPYRYSQQMLETEAENMRQLRMSVADNKQTKKLTGTSKITLDLQRPGPTTLTPVDFAKYLARCEGLTLAEWCKEQDVRTERALERERFKITERVKRAEKEAEDPRPDRKQFRDAEVALVAKRCGAGAMRKARNRLGKSMKPSRRARDASSVLGMMLLRSQGFGMVHPEQDVFWIEHELLMAKERIEPRRERLIELGITHILKARPPRPNLTTGPFLSSAMYARRAQVGPVLSNQHPQDFIYCRLYVSDKETARQDDIRREFGMGLAFASEALDLGGRVLICCPTGCRLAVAATVALLMQKRGMRLSTAYGVVKLHEPALQLSRALCLWLSLYEIELHHESSVVRDRTFTNPSLKQLVGELGLEPALPWPLPIYFLVGTVVLPDPYAFWNGRPRTDFRPWRKRYCAPRRRTSPVFARAQLRCPPRLLLLLLLRRPGRHLPRRGGARAEAPAEENRGRRRVARVRRVRRLRRRHLRLGLGLGRDGADGCDGRSHRRRAAVARPQGPPRPPGQEGERRRGGRRARARGRRRRVRRVRAHRRNLRLARDARHRGHAGLHGLPAVRAAARRGARGARETGLPRAREPVLSAEVLM